MGRTTEDKFNTVIAKNTFYFFNKAFQEKYEGYINSIRETLLLLKNEIETKGVIKEIFINMLAKNKNGLTALFALTGLSKEFFQRLITLIRVVDDKALCELALKEKWQDIEEENKLKEWSDKKIAKYIRENEFFRQGIVNIFFEGATLPFLVETVPLFELKKLGLSKLNFDVTAMIDTLVRYKEKGSYSGKSENNPEKVIVDLLDSLNIKYESGDLDELIENSPDTKRRMDFIIPSKNNPRIIIESSFMVTTSSNQGDKSKTEIQIRDSIKKHCPSAKFIGFVDGIGWYVRPEDLKRMVSAYEDVFTFHKEEIERFKNLLIREFQND
jgi:hypothetical protein